MHMRGYGFVHMGLSVCTKEGLCAQGVCGLCAQEVIVCVNKRWSCGNGCGLSMCAVYGMAFVHRKE